MPGPLKVELLANAEVSACGHAEINKATTYLFALFPSQLVAKAYKLTVMRMDGCCSVIHGHAWVLQLAGVGQMSAT
jgi:hypothetical protein